MRVSECFFNRHSISMELTIFSIFGYLCSGSYSSRWPLAYIRFDSRAAERRELLRRVSVNLIFSARNNCSCQVSFVVPFELLPDIYCLLDGPVIGYPDRHVDIQVAGSRLRICRRGTKGNGAKRKAHAPRRTDFVCKVAKRPIRRERAQPRVRTPSRSRGTGRLRSIHRRR
jgi:hypothetical protein